jgi:hypothetical protein
MPEWYQRLGTWLFAECQYTRWAPLYPALLLFWALAGWRPR